MPRRPTTEKLLTNLVSVLRLGCLGLGLSQLNSSIEATGELIQSKTTFET